MGNGIFTLALPRSRSTLGRQAKPRNSLVVGSKGPTWNSQFACQPDPLLVDSLDNDQIFHLPACTPRPCGPHTGPWSSRLVPTPNALAIVSRPERCGTLHAFESAVHGP